MCLLQSKLGINRKLDLEQSPSKKEMSFTPCQAHLLSYVPSWYVHRQSHLGWEQDANILIVPKLLMLRKKKKKKGLCSAVRLKTSGQPSHHHRRKHLGPYTGLSSQRSSVPPSHMPASCSKGTSTYLQPSLKPSCKIRSQNKSTQQMPSK